RERCGMGAPRRQHDVALFELRRAERGLELARAIAEADALEHEMTGLRLPASRRRPLGAPVVHEASHEHGERRVARAREAPDAGADEMGNACREAREVAEAADRAAAIRDEHRFAAVLDDAEPAPARDREDRIHVARESEEV